MSQIIGRLTVNGVSVEVEGDASSIKDIIQSLAAPVKPVVAKVAVEAAPKALRKKNKSYAKWTEADVLKAVEIARLHGANGHRVGEKIAAGVMATSDQRRSQTNLSVFGYRVFRYLTTGQNYGLSKTVMAIMNKNGVRAKELTEAPGFLGQVSEHTRSIPVEMA